MGTVLVLPSGFEVCGQELELLRAPCRIAEVTHRSVFDGWCNQTLS